MYTRSLLLYHIRCTTNIYHRYVLLFLNATLETAASHAQHQQQYYWHWDKEADGVTYPTTDDVTCHHGSIFWIQN